LLQSNQFDTTWGLSSASVTGGNSGYDGTNDAWELTKSGASGRVQQTISSSGVQTYSVYAKAGTYDWALLLVTTTSGDRIGYFDLANGVVGTGFSLIDSSIESVGGDWYRCTIVFDASTTTIRVYPAANDANLGTSGSIYIQDSQLESGLVSTSVIETTTTSVSAGILEDMPRLDYSGSCPSLLLEPQRTNFVTDSEYFEGSNWVGTNVNLTTNYGISPEGKRNSTRIVGTNQSILYYPLNSPFDGTRSIYVKATSGSGSIQLLSHNSNTDNIFEIDTNWQRVDVTDVQSGTGINNLYALDMRGAATDIYDIEIWGCQYEAASYPTSYIPCMGTSQTRSAEEYCKVNNIGDFPNEYTLFFEMEDIEASQNNSVVMDLYSTTANTISVRTYETSGDGRLRFVDIVNNSTLFYLEHTSRKYCIRVNGTSVDGFTNGALAVSATAGSSMNNLDDLNIRCGSAQRSLSKYKQIVAFPTALTDSECIALTTL